MRIWTVLSAVACVFLVGCGSTDVADGGVGPTRSTTGEVASPSAGPDASSAVPGDAGDEGVASSEGSGDSADGAVPDAVIAFLADLDAALADTAYADEVLESPEVFVATARLFCEQLDAGLTPDEVLTGYVETLTDSAIADADDDTLVLSGSLLGIGVGALCPQHAGLIDESY